MTGILDLPVTAHRVREGRDARREAGDEVAAVVFGPPRQRTTHVVSHGVHAADTLQVGPVGPVGEHGGRRDNAVGARFNPPVILFRLRHRLERGARPEAAVVWPMGEDGDEPFVEPRLIALDREHVVGAFRPDGGGNGGLAPDGVDGHGAVPQLQQRQHGGDGRDLIGLRVDGHLAEGQLPVAGPRTDGVQRARGGVAASARGLAVDGHDAGDLAGERPTPRGEPGREGLRIQLPQDPREGVVRGDAVGQLQKGREPRLPGETVGRELGVVIGTAQRREERNGEHVGERMSFRACDARIRQGGQLGEQGERHRRLGRQHGQRHRPPPHAPRGPPAPSR